MKTFWNGFEKRANDFWDNYNDAYHSGDPAEFAAFVTNHKNQNRLAKEYEKQHAEHMKNTSRDTKDSVPKSALGVGLGGAGLGGFIGLLHGGSKSGLIGAGIGGLAGAGLGAIGAHSGNVAIDDAKNFMKMSPKKRSAIHKEYGEEQAHDDRVNAFRELKNYE